MVKYRSLEHTIIGTMFSEKFPDKKKKSATTKDAPQDDNKDPAQEDQGGPQSKKDAGPPQPNGQQQPVVKAPPVKKVKDPQAEKMDAGDEPVKLGQGNAVDLKPELETPNERDKPVQESLTKWWTKSNPVRNVDKTQDQHLANMTKHARIAKGYEDQANNPPLGLRPAHLRMHVDTNKKMADMHHRQAGSSLGWFLKNDTSKEGAMKAYKALREDCDMSDEMINEKLTDDAKKKIRFALQHQKKKDSHPAKSLIYLAKTNPKNIVKKEEVEINKERIDELIGKSSLPSLIKKHSDLKTRHTKFANHFFDSNEKRSLNHSLKADFHGKKIEQGKKLAKQKEEIEMTALQNVKTILEARHRAGGGAKGVGRTVKDGYGKTMQVNSKGQDTEGDDHIINQLRKASNLRDHSITFKNKEKAHVPSHHAKKALEIYSGLKTSQEKSHMASRMHSSHGAFKDALSGKVAPPAGKRKITLPFDWRK